MSTENFRQGRKFSMNGFNKSNLYFKGKIIREKSLKTGHNSKNSTSEAGPAGKREQ